MAAHHENWVEVGTVADIPRLGARRVCLAGHPIAIFRTADDAVYALVDRCPHRGGPLSEGIVSGKSVACPLHNWVIDLATGCAHGPDEGATETLSVRVTDGRIFLSLAALAAEAPA